MLACGTSRKSANQPFKSAPVRLPGLVTATSLSVAGASAGTDAVRWALSTTATPPAGTPPTVTVAPARKFAPLTVTPVPPAAGPDLGPIAETIGRGSGVAVGVGVGLGVRVAVGVGVTVGVGVGVGVGAPVNAAV